MGGMVASAGQIGVAASVVINLTALAFYVRSHFFGDSGGAEKKTGNTEEAVAATVTPSLGKPSVTPESIVNLDHGDPAMFEVFWRGAVGDSARFVIPGWQTMSYFSDVGGLCWFLEPAFEREVRRLHCLIGNATVDGYHVLIGTGSTQLFQAALFALSPPGADVPMSVVSRAPYYSSYPAVTDFLSSGLYRWAGDANKFKGERYIELVCSPSNPDGGIREAVLAKSDSGKAIHDLAYYWPQYAPITKPAAHDVMLFTVSKCTGHAGTRIGWALVKEKAVAQRMSKFIELNTIGVSKDSQLRAAKIIGAVVDSYERRPSPPAAGVDADHLFHFSRRQMANRWRALRAAVAASGIFSLPDEVAGFCTFAKEIATANPPFAWLRCEKEGVEDLESLLREHKIITRGGDKFGADRKVVRISMVDTDEAFGIFIHRLAAMK